MAHIRKCSENRWQARTSTTAGGKRRELARNFNSEREAKAWLRSEGAVIEQRGIGGGDGTVAAYFTQWLAHLDTEGRLQPKTALEYQQRVGRLVPLIGHKRLDRLSTLDLDQAYAWLLKSGGRYGKGLQPRTVVCTHRTIFMALKRARRWKLIADNPAEDVTLPALGRSPARAPTAEELARYLDAVRATPLWPFVLIGITTGLRRGEICGLRWADIDMEKCVLRVTQVVCEAGDKCWIRPRPKTAAAVRQVSFPPVLAEELARLRLRQKEERLLYGASYRRDLDLVFCVEGGEMWSPDRLTGFLSRIARKAGLPKTAAPAHCLRHFHASAMIGTVPLKIVSTRLGHASVSTTANIYMHTNAELDRSAADAIEAVVRPLVTKREP